MSPTKFSMAAVLDYDAESMEAFIRTIEMVIDCITKDKSIRFFLKIAVNELIVNAVEHGYNKHGGPVVVYLSKSDDSIALEVSDNGRGIQAESLNLERIAENPEDLTTRGWGLSILKNVSSRLCIKDNNPSGTVISVTMPL